MPVDPHIPLPIYQQIVEHVCSAVASGVFRTGETLPSIRKLALELVVNPNTVQRAYQELERQGLVRMRRGLGVFVADNGKISATRHVESAVRERFAQGVRVGRDAGLDSQRMESLFRGAMDPASRDSTDGPRPGDDTPVGERKQP